MIKQIREVVSAEQPKANPFLEQAQKEKREREYQKEKETFQTWLREQWVEAEAAMEKKVAEKTEQRRKLVSKPPTVWEEVGEASRLGVGRWASEISPSIAPNLPPAESS
jgi:hypothetical protein